MKKQSSLTPEQARALETLVKSGITKNFYLGGGTALMLKYGHRFSQDFDFFNLPGTDDKIDTFKMSQVLPNTELKLLERDTLIFFLGGVKCSFYVYPYPLLEKPLFDEKSGVWIADDKDIIAMKAIALIQRGTKRDFFDTQFLMSKNSWSLEDLISFCLKKYKNFSEELLLKAIVYFKDAEKERHKAIDEKWDEIKAFFQNELKRYLDMEIPDSPVSG